MTELVLSVTSAPVDLSTKLDSSTVSEWGEADLVDSSTSLPIVTGDPVDIVTEVRYGINTTVDVVTNLNNEGQLVPTHTITSTRKAGAKPHDVTWNLIKPDDLHATDSVSLNPYWNILPIKDTYSTSHHRAVNILFNKPKAPDDVKYLPTSDFNITDELAGFTTDFIKPIDYDKLKTVLSPVDGVSSLPWDRHESVDIFKKLNYGYSLNDFLIGGSTDTNYPVDEDALEPPDPEPEPPTEVIKVVNIINVVTLPERTALAFSDLSLAIDLESVAWVFQFTLSDKASFDLVKPSGLTVKELEVDINGEKFNVFIGRTRTSIQAEQNGTVRKTYTCTGWSLSKLLSYPYSAKRSHTETSGRTAAQLLDDELTGTGFTGTWGSPSWLIPANVFGYIDKAPLAAISELAQSVGGVIVPANEGKSISVKPYYPVSPWNWGTETPDRILSEASFFTVDTEWIPQESPDSIYVYGEENGVGVKCVKSGEAGNKTLPTIVDKHITDNVAGQERGRIEVAKAGFKEIIPISTYVDENGIVMPQELLEINEIEGGSWRGMVVSTRISLKRNGNALVQQLQIERHYDN